MLLCFLILAFIVVASVMLTDKEENPAAEKPITYSEAAGAVDRSYRELLLAEREVAPEINGAIESLHGALAVFTDAFGHDQPAELSGTRDWDKKMIALKRHAGKTAELLLENNPEAARAEAESAYRIFLAAKSESGLTDRLTTMLSLYESGMAVSGAQTKEEAIEYLQPFKLIFTEIKKDNIDERYADLMKRAELAIMDIERLLPGPDLSGAQSDLAAITSELFFNY